MQVSHHSFTTFFHWLSGSQNNFVQSAAPQWNSSMDFWRAGLDLSASRSNGFNNNKKNKLGAYEVLIALNTFKCALTSKRQKAKYRHGGKL